MPLSLQQAQQVEIFATIASSAHYLLPAHSKISHRLDLRKTFALVFVGYRFDGPEAGDQGR
jgi:hypothetical protein